MGRDARPKVNPCRKLSHVYAVSEVTIICEIAHQLRPGVRPSVRSFISGQVRSGQVRSCMGHTSNAVYTVERNEATSHYAIFVEVYKTFSTIWVSRSCEVKIKVTSLSKSRKWPISMSVSFAFCWNVSNNICDSDHKRQYSNLLLPDSSVSLSFYHFRCMGLHIWHRM